MPGLNLSNSSESSGTAALLMLSQHIERLLRFLKIAEYLLGAAMVKNYGGTTKIDSKYRVTGIVHTGCTCKGKVLSVLNTCCKVVMMSITMSSI